jgi:hypothetical protein
MGRIAHKKSLETKGDEEPIELLSATRRYMCGVILVLTRLSARLHLECSLRCRRGRRVGELPEMRCATESESGKCWIIISNGIDRVDASSSAH